jgi:hypothetical protein
MGHSSFRRIAASLGLFTGLLSVLQATPAFAAAPVRIAAAYYDPNNPAGAASNAQLNMEYIVIHNYSSQAKALGGWTLRDLKRPTKPAHVYRFGTYKLGAGKTVRIHTGKGTNTATDRFWGLTFYVWGDDGDTATLKNSAGVTVSKCSWTSTDTSPKYC